ncbi:hypothetical protein BpHYR1_046111 [Brachionus plicatilis]|uniref:Uncharacterized protein n=1 Tax=Brachionus plicatilis TaxID=10195 RepID=A0A3M7QMG6_BRAPC|nr:hypothetical protein BpHYR1_046111 [Brachionus plicatilis]
MEKFPLFLTPNMREKTWRVIFFPRKKVFLNNCGPNSIIDDFLIAPEDESQEIKQDLKNQNALMKL